MSSNTTKHYAESLRGGSPIKKDQPAQSIACVGDCLNPDEEARVKATFDSFAMRGEMVGSKFAKFCRDNKLAGSKLSSTDIDLIFAKSVAKGTRKLSYEQFRHRTLPLVADKRGSGLDRILKHICKNGGGPVFVGTKAKKVRHHDDKSTYTGVYGRGGPTNVDLGTTQISLGGDGQGFKSLADRSEYDVRGVKIEESRDQRIAGVSAKASEALAGATFVAVANSTGKTEPPRSDSGSGSGGGGGGGNSDMQSFLLALNIPADDAVKYAAKLKDDGFDVVADLKTMSEGDFVDIGMKKGHIRKVAHAVQTNP